MRFKKMKIQKHNHWSICYLEGRIDAFCDKFLLENLAADLKSEKFLVINLAGVDFLSLVAMRGFVELRNQALANAGDVVLMGPTPAVRRHIESYLGRTGIRTYKDCSELDREDLVHPRAEFRNLNFIEGAADPIDSLSGGEESARLLVFPRL